MPHPLHTLHGNGCWVQHHANLPGGMREPASFVSWRHKHGHSHHKPSVMNTQLSPRTATDYTAVGLADTAETVAEDLTPVNTICFLISGS